RSVLLKAGLSEQPPALTVNRLCGSGLQAIISAAQQIELDVCNVAVARRTEVMSRGGYLLPRRRSGARRGNAEVIDMVVGALTCPASRCHMGRTAEAIAEKWQISREAQDELALQSHQRAQAAIEAGRFKEQIVPVELKSKKGTTLFEVDEHVRLNARLEDMQKLRPVFKKEGGTVTAGNASGIND